MRKINFFFVLLAVMPSLYAFEPGKWTIIRPDGLYAGGKVTENSMKGKNILDFAIVGGHKLYVVTNDHLIHLEDTSDGKLGLGSPLKIYLTSYIKDKLKAGWNNPRIVAVGEKGLNIMVPKTVIDNKDMFTTSNPYDYYDAYDIRIKKNVKYMLNDYYNIGCNKYGWALSGMRLHEIPRKDNPARMDNIAYYGIIYSTPKGDGFAEIAPEELKAQSGDEGKIIFSDLTTDKNGTVWALGTVFYEKDGFFSGNSNVTSVTRLWKAVGDELMVVNIPAVRDINVDKDGNAVIATASAILTIDNDNNTTAILKEGATHIAFGNDGALWYAPSENDLVRYEPATGEKYFFNEENSPLKGRIRKILTDSKNYKYILAGDETQNALYVIKEPESVSGDWQIINDYTTSPEIAKKNYFIYSNQLPGNKTIALLPRDEHQTCTYQDGKWSYQPYEMGKAGLMFGWSGITSANNKIYGGTAFNFVYTVDNGKFDLWKELDQKQMGKGITALHTDKNNHLWIGSMNGLAKYDGSTFTYYSKKTDKLGLPDVNILSLTSAGDDVFAGTTDGMSVLSNGTWKFYDKKTGGLENKRVVAMAANSKNQVYIISEGILSRTKKLSIYENGEIKNEDISETGLGPVKKMIVDADDNLWIAQTKWLICRKANGEYVFYDDDTKDYPVKGDVEIADMAVYDGKVHLSVRPKVKVLTPAEYEALSPFEREIKGRIYSFGANQVFILKTK
jgi:hypothetical protein